MKIRACTTAETVSASWHTHARRGSLIDVALAREVRWSPFATARFHHSDEKGHSGRERELLTNRAGCGGSLHYRHFRKSFMRLRLNPASRSPKRRRSKSEPVGPESRLRRKEWPSARRPTTCRRLEQPADLRLRTALDPMPKLRRQRLHHLSARSGVRSQRSLPSAPRP